MSDEWDTRAARIAFATRQTNACLLREDVLASELRRACAEGEARGLERAALRTTSGARSYEDGVREGLEMAKEISREHELRNNGDSDRQRFVSLTCAIRALKAVPRG